MQFWYELLINLPKNLGKKPITTKNTKEPTIFQKFEHSSLPILIIKQHKKNREHNYMRHLFYFVHFQHKSPLTLTKILKEKTETVKNTKKSSFFTNWNTHPCQHCFENKIKTIGHTTTCDIILCSSNIKHSLTFPKTWGKGPKRLKILIIKQNKNNWARTYM